MDLGKSELLGACRASSPVFPRLFRHVGTFPSVWLVRVMAGARRSGGAAENMLGLQSGLSNPRMNECQASMTQCPNFRVPHGR